MAERKNSSHIELLDRNIDALVKQREQKSAGAGWQERLALRTTDVIGSMLFVWLHVAAVLAWIVINLGWTPLKPFDPTFVVLASIASVEAIFLSSFILITQNRMQAQAESRADLHLQISLLSEHEITRLVSMIREMGRKMQAESAGNPELEELEEDIQPEKVLERIERQRAQEKEAG